ncbi:DUF2167 domain-containing protein [Paenibacillus brevis]|uniref:DUF2167 domain-containing protein n=1 Tax=Paenibacillus brevis TaxID=2841508 RepID=A0ABS6FKU1_9BACL|nr:DUF2167 domain-containing protein [Paenibacillus brevis]MBU5670556.1 DUF2167 domain-containing protein [Paenibacillus brevis]
MNSSTKKHKLPRLLLSCVILLSLFAMPFAAAAEAVEPELNWIEGSGQTVRLSNIAELTLPENYFFLDEDDTIAFIEGFQDLPSYREIGYVEPAYEDTMWSVYFEYEETGHIEDEEKSDIDAKALLKSYKDGQEAANEELPEYNHLFVDGWFQEPAYDDSLRSLTWALLLHDIDGEPLINYNVRVLTRVGYISAILVSDPENLAADRSMFESEILPNLTVTSGNTYADFDPSKDKKSSLGLTGLILGGAGAAVAKKTGLIALITLIVKKFWFLILAPFLWFGKLFKKKNKDTGPVQDTLPADNSGSSLDMAPNVQNYQQPSAGQPDQNRFRSKFEAENDPNNKPPTSM